MATPSSELLRIDPLTECKNFLGFLETLTSRSLSEIPGDGRSREALEKSGIDSSHYSAILFVEMNHVKSLNESRGRAYGDSVIRWMGILLREESSHEVYRLGGVEFVVLLDLDTRDQHVEFIERISERIEREARLLGIPDSAASMALIYFDESPTGLDTLLLNMGEAMVKAKNNTASGFMAFESTDFKIRTRPTVTATWQANSDSDVSFAVRWISRINIYQVLELGLMLDKAQQEAYTDAISGLPNMRAALLNMEQALEKAQSTGKPFSVLMIDGDNFRAYNNINYAAGDEMIRDISALYRNKLRPNDFVARWRSGDEFLVILPETPAEGAKIIAERMRLAVKEVSQAWKYPVTISIGLATYPVHAQDLASLIDCVETANKRAKDQGKDRVTTAGSSVEPGMYT